MERLEEYHSSTLYQVFSAVSEDNVGDWILVTKFKSAALMFENLEADGVLKVHVRLDKSQDKPSANDDGFVIHTFTGASDRFQQLNDCFPCSWLKIERVIGVTPTPVSVLLRLTQR